MKGAGGNSLGKINWQSRSKLLSFLPVNKKSSYSLLISSRILVCCSSMCSAEKKLSFPFPNNAHRWVKRIIVQSCLTCTKCILKLRTAAKLYHARKKSNSTQRATHDRGAINFFSVFCRNTSLPALRKKKNAPTITVKNLWKDPIFSDIRNTSVRIAPNSAPCAVILWLLLFLRSVSSPF